jgi:hypothetical protein
MPMFDFLTDAQYIALGRVVANAAELESLLATILTNLLELNEKQARALIPVMMARKIELLEKLHPVDDEVGKKDLKDLTRVLRDLNDKRNTVVHGIWYPSLQRQDAKKKASGNAGGEHSRRGRHRPEPRQDLSCGGVRKPVERAGDCVFEREGFCDKTLVGFVRAKRWEALELFVAPQPVHVVGRQICIDVYRVVIPNDQAYVTRCPSMLGLKSFRSATISLAGF